MEEEFLVEERCLNCDKLQGIAGFKVGERRRPGLLVTCASPVCIAKAKELKRPHEDELIIAAIRKEEGTALPTQLALLEKWGTPSKDTKRYQFLYSFRRAQNHMEFGNYQDATKEMFSILKTIMRI